MAPNGYSRSARRMLMRRTQRSAIIANIELVMWITTFGNLEFMDWMNIINLSH